MSGSEMAREKEKVAAKMREKQAAGSLSFPNLPCLLFTAATIWLQSLTNSASF